MDACGSFPHCNRDSAATPLKYSYNCTKGRVEHPEAPNPRAVGNRKHHEIIFDEYLSKRGLEDTK